MGKAILKKEYKDTVVAFGKSGVPLGYRDDLDDLAIIAHQSGDKTIKNLFEELPPLEELQKARVESKIERPSTPKVEKPSNK